MRDITKMKKERDVHEITRQINLDLEDHLKIIKEEVENVRDK